MILYRLAIDFLIDWIAISSYAETYRLQQSGAEEACWAHNPEVGGSKPPSATYTFSTHNGNKKNAKKQYSLRCALLISMRSMKLVRHYASDLPFDSIAGPRSLGLAHPKREAYLVAKWSSQDWTFGSLLSGIDGARIKNASKIDAQIGKTRWPSG